MNNMTRNILAIVIGVVVGAVVNMGLVNVGPSVIPPPGGADVTDMETLKASMKLFEPKHFIFPFLAHALGTLVGAFVATKIAVSNKLACALLVGLVFLTGGITMVYLVGGPMWFIVTDLVLAYIPMAYLGGKSAGAKK